MLLDSLMGTTAIVLGALMAFYSAPLAALMREGDERWRENAWTETFEPNVRLLETDRGRWMIFRGWLLLAATGFVTIGAGLVLRVVL